MVLPLYATLERLDHALFEAAADLGAKPFVTLCAIMIPLSTPGLSPGLSLCLFRAWEPI